MAKKGSAFIFAAAVLWGTAGIFVKRLSAYGIGPMSTVVYRCMFTMAVMGILLLIKNPGGFRIRAKDAYLFVLNGMFSIVMFNFCYYKTMELSNLSVAAILLYTAPIFVMIISVLFLGEKLTAKKVAALLIAFSGCMFVTGVFGSSSKISAAAIVYGLFTGFGYALYTIFGNQLIRRGYDTVTIIFYTFVFASLGAFSLNAFSGQAAQLAFRRDVWLWGFLMAVFNTVLPYIFYTYGLKFVNPSTAPIIATVEPVAATVVGLFYGEKLTVSGVIGIVLVLLSILILNIRGGETGGRQGIRENQSHA